MAKHGDGGLVYARNNFYTAPIAAKNDTRFKSGQKWLKNNHIAKSKSVTRSVGLPSWSLGVREKV